MAKPRSRTYGNRCGARYNFYGDCVVLIICLICFIANTRSTSAKHISMKIVEEPAGYGINQVEPDVQSSSSMQPRIPPSNFSGPSHLHRLLGRCYTLLNDAYRYEFCPFQNLTQHELSLRWNPYSGILGIWREWEIYNNTFMAMKMAEGDSCGQVFRSAKIMFVCGDVMQVTNVTEPDTCNYHVTFKTPLVCHPHSMLVYPSLNETLRHRWDLLEGQFQTSQLTVKGYEKQLRKIFEDAELQLSEQHHAKTVELEGSTRTTGQFENLSKCTEEYQKLTQEVEGLRTLLALYEQQPGHNSTHPEKS